MYVLESKQDRKHYTGIINNLERRLGEHNKGSGATKSTKGRGPFKIVYQEEVADSKAAREREKFLKSGKGREFLKLNKIPE